VKSGALIISFKDDGKGIDKEDINDIFDFGFTTTSGGSGIGLYFVKDLLEEMGGTIKVDSKKNQGAEFILEIPK
jgi:signal transduction histidine kinase